MTAFGLYAAADTVKEITEDIGEASKIFSLDNLLNYLGTALRLLILVLILFIAWRLLRFLLRRMLLRQVRRADVQTRAQIKTAGNLVESILGYLLIFFGIVGCLSIFGFDMRGLVASAGVAGLLIAFISQSVIKDWVSGLFIILEHQHNVGDWVRMGSYEGEVLSVGMRTTVLRTWENETIYLPNGTIAEVVNLSKVAQRGILDIGIDYKATNSEVEKILTAVAVAMNDKYEAELAEEVVVLGIQSLAESAVIWRLTFTAKNQRHFFILRELRRHCKDALEQAGIAIPYPQLTISQREEQKECH